MKTTFLLPLVIVLLLPGLNQARSQKCADGVCRNLKECYREEKLWGPCPQDPSQIYCCFWVGIKYPPRRRFGRF
ncbi:Hypothetical predicted protein [Podarcis lilfordi]|uniref:Beta-defensin n=1 Tax=Podarcis lilfordi TaxID=74358 RepID=A0AA35K6H5_9SAUR|nr:Hypothetical predicted protein [Podarcis lilfordi]